MPPSTGLFAVLVNYREWMHTVSCARALARAGLPPDQVVVVDNPSPGPSGERIADLLPTAVLRREPVNVGFAAGANAGAALALARGAEAVLFLNADTLFTPDLVTVLSAAVGTDAVAAPEVFRTTVPGSPWFAGAWDGRWPGSMRYRLPGDARLEVDYLWATCLMIGRDAWRRVGPFDPSYFLFYEDVDWCARARDAGLQPRIVPGARLWHAVGASFCGPTAPLRRYHLARSAVVFHARRARRGGARRGWLALGGVIHSALRLAIRGDGAGFMAHGRGIIDGCRAVGVFARQAEPSVARRRVAR